MAPYTDVRNDQHFDHYARLVRRLLGVPVGLVSLVEADRQVFPGASGLGEPYATLRETPLSHSFCQYVVRDEQPLTVTDAREHPVHKDNPAIRDLGAVAYAGWPLTDETGRTVGSLCAIDHEARVWSTEDLAILEDLASACSVEIAERGRRDEYARALVEAQGLAERSRALLALSTGLATTETLADVAAAVAEVSTEQLGCERAGMWLRPADHVIASPGAGGVVAAPDSAGAIEMLSFVEDSAQTWLSARTFPELAYDASNPLGACLVAGELLFYASRAEQNDLFPHLANPHQLGDARAYVPLVTEGRVYGALALMWPRVRSLSHDDRATITALASYTAQALHRALLFQERVDVALTLQNALLTRLPKPAGLDLAARYLPAGAREQVGGDWYDAVVMSDGATYVMVGDAMGHDIEAAAVMGQLRSMLRMAAWMSPGAVSGPAGRAPSLALTGLDRAMRDLDVDTFATAVIGRIEAGAEDGVRFQWSNAGHLPPLVLAPDGTATFLDGSRPPTLLLGANPDTARHDDVADLVPGSFLLLYTDGLVERRAEALEVGLERLRAAATRASRHSADAFVDDVLRALADGSPDDDVALLAARVR